MKVYTFDNKVLTHDSKWLKEAIPAPQEIIIPPCWPITADNPYQVYVTDIPLNTDITFSYDSYNGSGGQPSYIEAFYYRSNWTTIDGNTYNISNNKATLRFTELPADAYIMVINVYSDDSYLAQTDFTNLKLYYMA